MKGQTHGSAPTERIEEIRLVSAGYLCANIGCPDRQIIALDHQIHFCLLVVGVIPQIVELARVFFHIEQFPGEYLATGSDPDISTSGSNVVVVYVDGGNVICARSPTDGSTYDPGHNWQMATVDSGAAPSVFMSGSTVQVAYVKGGDVYKAESTDGGATFGAPEKLNSVDGTVSDEKGSVAINDIGVVNFVFKTNKYKDSRSPTYIIVDNILVPNGILPLLPFYIE